MNSNILMQNKNLIEQLASIEHDRWAHWQEYMHSQCTVNGDGSLTIPKELVARWEKQINTKFIDLSESEKQSDRDQVLKYLPTIDLFIENLSK